MSLDNPRDGLHLIIMRVIPDEWPHTITDDDKPLRPQDLTDVGDMSRPQSGYGHFGWEGHRDASCGFG